MIRDFDIPAILREHNDTHVPLPLFEKIQLFDVNGQHEFPIIGMSGGVCASSMVYFYVGEIAGDLGRCGLKEHHDRGLSWGVELPYWMETAVPKIRADLEAFDQAIRKMQSERLKK